VYDIDAIRNDLLSHGVEVRCSTTPMAGWAAAFIPAPTVAPGPDPDWLQWYAEHMTRTLGGTGYLTRPSA
jgi:hypothetical protein